MYLILFFGLLSTQLSLANVGVATCIKGSCPEGYFCHEWICNKCLKCDLLFRKGNFCVTDFNNCEDCLEGYEEVLVTDFSNVKKPCKQVKKKVKIKLCDDSNCPKNNYCNEGSCIKCFDCSLLNRMPPNEKCAKGLNECGSCMIGYYEVSVTTEVKYKPCERDTLIIPEIPKEMPVSVTALVCIFIFVILAPIYFYDHCKNRGSNKTINSQPPIHPSAPPLYSMDCPETPFVRNTEGYHPTAIEYVEERKQQAKVFKQPTASYYYNDNNSSNNNNNNEGTISDDDSNDAVMENNNGNSTTTSFAPSNSAQPEEEECPLGMIRSRHSELALNELGVNFVHPKECTAKKSEPPGADLDAVDSPAVPQPSENSTDEETDLVEPENEEKRTQEE